MSRLIPTATTITYAARILIAPNSGASLAESELSANSSINAELVPTVAGVPYATNNRNITGEITLSVVHDYASQYDAMLAKQEEEAFAAANPTGALTVATAKPDEPGVAMSAYNAALASLNHTLTAAAGNKVRVISEWTISYAAAALPAEGEEGSDTLNQLLTVLQDLKRGAQGEKGERGTTFTPAVSADGTLSWTNDGGAKNPPSVSIRGPQGEPGKDGKDGADGAAADVSISTPEGTSNANFDIVIFSSRYTPRAGSRLLQVRLPSRNSSSISNTPYYLSLFQEQADGSLEYLATSDNAIAQVLATEGVWNFSNLTLSGANPQGRLLLIWHEIQETYGEADAYCSHSGFVLNDMISDGDRRAVGLRTSSHPEDADSFGYLKGGKYTYTVQCKFVASWCDPSGGSGAPGAQGPKGEKGDPGPYYTPSVSPDGLLTWTNNGDLPNPAAVNIRGPKGDKGAPGDSSSSSGGGSGGSFTPGDTLKQPVLANPIIVLNHDGAAQSTLADPTFTPKNTVVISALDWTPEKCYAYDHPFYQNNFSGDFSAQVADSYLHAQIIIGSGVNDTALILASATSWLETMNFDSFPTNYQIDVPMFQGLYIRTKNPDELDSSEGYIAPVGAFGSENGALQNDLANAEYTAEIIGPTKPDKIALLSGQFQLSPVCNIYDSKGMPLLVNGETIPEEVFRGALVGNDVGEDAVNIADYSATVTPFGDSWTSSFRGLFLHTQAEFGSITGTFLQTTASSQTEDQEGATPTAEIVGPLKDGTKCLISGQFQLTNRCWIWDNNGKLLISQGAEIPGLISNQQDIFDINEGTLSFVFENGVLFFQSFNKKGVVEFQTGGATYRIDLETFFKTYGTKV